jgi:Ca-activated chloride channel family protein
MQRFNPSAQLDEQTLVSIAEKTGGKYFRAREVQELEDIYRELDRLEPVEQNQQWFRPTKSFFTWPLLAALALSILPVIRVWLSNLRIPRTG